MVEEPDFLNELRTSLQRKKADLSDMVKAYKETAETETDEFKRVVFKGLMKHAVIMQDLFNNIEMFAVLNSGFRDHTEILKNILEQLTEVKQNPQLQSYIQTTYVQFGERYRKQLESFTRHLDDLEKL